MRIATPDNFSFRSTVLGHGWCDLAPFALDEDEMVLSHTLNDIGGGAVEISVRQAGESDDVEVSNGRAESNVGESARRTVEHMLRLDEDFSGFYEAIRGEPELEWIETCGAGRLLRSPTVFEDLVKTICTTNCTWALTKAMVSNLVAEYGTSCGAGSRAFPRSTEMARGDEAFYRERIKTGYRSPFLVELARTVAEGDLDPESWLDPAPGSDEIKKEMLSVKGVGNYAAENLLKLVGRYDGLALDSFLRAGFYKKHRQGSKCPDSEIEAHYERFGEWKGLVIWFEMSERWVRKTE